MSVPTHVPRGRIVAHSFEGSHRADYYLYVPKRMRAEARFLVSVHGTSRNAAEHVLHQVELAERHGVAIVAPHFRRQRHRGYQRLEARPGRPTADSFLDRIIEEVTDRMGEDPRPFVLFGYSGGAQFAHRYAMLHPSRIAGLVVASAGWYTLPIETLPYPYGSGSTQDSRYARLDLRVREFLRLPIHVVVGSRDTEQDAALNTSTRVVESQGADRVRRAHTWRSRLMEAACHAGVASRISLDVMPEIGHSFSQSMLHGGLEGILDTALTEAVPHRESRAAP